MNVKLYDMKTAYLRRMDLGSVYGQVELETGLKEFMLFSSEEPTNGLRERRSYGE